MKKLLPILLLVGSTILSGCGDSNDFNEVSGQQGGGGGGIVGVEPQAVDDLYATDRNEAFTLAPAQGVLANDQINTNNFAAVTVAFPAATAQGGTISGGLNDGAFTYSPAVGFVGTDTFTYTLSNGFGASTAMVSIVVEAAQVQQGFIVDSATGNDATGNFDTGAPFATIQGAVAAAPINADITVRPGNYTGVVNLKNGQRLLGAGSTRVNAQGTTRPVLTGPVVLADGNTLDFLRIQGTQGNAIDGDGQNGGTVTNCEITNTVRVGPSTGTGVSVETASGRWTVTNNRILDVGGAGIDFGTVGSASLTAIVNNNTVTNSAFNGIAFVVGNSSQVLAQVNGNILTSNGINATVEIIVGDTATFGLDLEDNRNDDVYSLFRENTGAVFQIEQLSTLTGAKPGGAGNTGLVDIATGSIAAPPTEVPNGTFSF